MGNMGSDEDVDALAEQVSIRCMDNMAYKPGTPHIGHFAFMHYRLANR